MSPIRGVIFDLDDTLFDCTGQLTEPARRRAASVFSRHTPDATAHDLTALQRELSDRLGSSDAIREIGMRYGLASSVVDEALLTYNRDDVPAIEAYPDAASTLDTLLDQGLILSLVTTGRRSRQFSKVDRLALSGYVVADRNIFIHEPDESDARKDKQLKEALASAELLAAETLSVGDKLDSDILIGNQIGLITVRIRKGRQRDVEPTDPAEEPAYDIQDLGELIPIILGRPS